MRYLFYWAFHAVVLFMWLWVYCVVLDVTSPFQMIPVVISYFAGMLLGQVLIGLKK